MKNKKELMKFIDHVNGIGSYYIYDASFSFHFEKWVMLPSCGRRFRMDNVQFEFFKNTTIANFAGACSYAQGIGLDPL